MSKRKSIVSIVVVFVATWAVPGNAAEQRDTLPKPPDKQTLRADQVKQLLLLMDTDESGKISKQEWLKFMEAEFDRLDKDRSGILNTKALAPSPLHTRHFADMGR